MLPKKVLSELKKLSLLHANRAISDIFIIFSVSFFAVQKLNCNGVYIHERCLNKLNTSFSLVINKQ